MLKAWRTPSRLSLKRLRSAHRGLESISPNWMRTYSCRDCWKAFSVRENGWQQGSVKSAASPAVRPRKRLRERMESWAAGRRSELRDKSVGTIYRKGRNGRKGRSGLPRISADVRGLGGTKRNVERLSSTFLGWRISNC